MNDLAQMRSLYSSSQGNHDRKGGLLIGLYLCWMGLVVEAAVLSRGHASQEQGVGRQRG